MSTVTRIVAAVVDVRNLTMYVEDGSTITIPQGDPRLRKIVSEATPQLIAQGWADVVIGPADENSYAQFEQEGSGAVKFFRIAKAKLKNLFTEKPPEPKTTDHFVTALSIGTVPAPQATPAAPALVPAEGMVHDNLTDAVTAADANVTAFNEVVGDGTDNQEEVFEPVVEVQQPKLEQTMSAVEEIMKHAIPASAPDFHEKNVARQGNVVETNGETIKEHNNNDDSPDTIIAVINNKVIPGMERIKTQFSRAAKMGSTAGVENFLRRIASVIEQRAHSVDDLLKFMERGDLPIADDGSILIYKVLRRKHRDEGKYVDCHSGKVEQWTGAYVCMDEKLVDHNRNNECSNGLHVARRGYIRCFSGDVCVLAKLAPEDVIAVPQYDANKMRVCGYHILAELNEAQYNEVKCNRPITNTEEGKMLLANALTGKHVRRTHEVRITAHQGGGVQVKTLAKEEAPAPVPTPDAPATVAALENLVGETLDQPTDPKEVIKAVEKEQLSRKEQATILHDAFIAGKPGALEALMAFKKAAKVGWDKLGISDPNVVTADKPKVAKPFPAPKGKVKVNMTKKARKAKAKAEAKKAAPAVSTTKTRLGIAAETKKLSEPSPGVVKAIKARALTAEDLGLPVVVPSEGSARERIAKLLAIGITGNGIAQAILTIKKQSKKSWAILGVADVTADQILDIVEGKKG